MSVIFKKFIFDSNKQIIEDGTMIFYYHENASNFASFNIVRLLITFWQKNPIFYINTLYKSFKCKYVLRCKRKFL